MNAEKVRALRTPRSCRNALRTSGPRTRLKALLLWTLLTRTRTPRRLEQIPQKEPPEDWGRRHGDARFPDRHREAPERVPRGRHIRHYWEPGAWKALRHSGITETACPLRGEGHTAQRTLARHPLQEKGRISIIHRNAHKCNRLCYIFPQFPPPGRQLPAHAVNPFRLFPLTCSECVKSQSVSNITKT